MAKQPLPKPNLGLQKPNGGENLGLGNDQKLCCPKWKYERKIGKRLCLVWPFRRENPLAAPKDSLGPGPNFGIEKLEKVKFGLPAPKML